MGIIQNALNQTINTVGIAARLSPGYETKQELYKTKKEMSGYKKLAKTIEAKQGPVTQAEANIATNLGTSIELASAKRLALDPTEKNLAAYEQNVKAAEEQKKAYEKALGPIVTPADPDEILQEQAMLKAAQQQENKKTQKRNFKDYLGKLESSLGGAVGDLPANVQKEIAKQYTSSQRKELMDKIDKESKK